MDVPPIVLGDGVEEMGEQFGDVLGVFPEGGQLEVGFYCDGAAGCWARIDDVTLVRIADLSSSVSSMPASQQSVRQPFFSATGAASSMPHSGLNIVRVVENGVTKTKKFWN